MTDIMISVEAARARIAAALLPMDSEPCTLIDAPGRTLAAPVIAALTQPPFAASAMDGYAVRSSDLGETPSRLSLQGESAAGHGFDLNLKPGHAIRISTGAPMPQGADQVVMQERAVRDGNHITLDDTPRPASNVRAAGIDFKAGDILLPAGTLLSPDAVALAAGSGGLELTVHRRPRVGILSTGDELVEPGQTPGPHQIINSIAWGLDGLVRQWGGEPVYLGIARDSKADVRARLEAARGLDLIVTIGGASVGDHDHLRQVFNAMDGELAFGKIAVKPGKPSWFGRLGESAFLGLPGNPVSSLVMARLLLQPALAILCGRPESLEFATVILGEDLPANGMRENFVRARIDRQTGRVHPLGNQDSSALSALVHSNALIRREVEAPAVRAGETTQILPL
ncbi:gephyrin-like molybdotransferase Glp [Maricaulis sp.]|uniref:molybdopterin molybdotransferase MoeA n=1 Tax=Maricaulis sp. TaxID=1486257 RepID=UPI003A94ACB2